MTMQTTNMDEVAPTQRRRWSKFAVCDESTSSDAPNQPGRGCSFATIVYDEAIPTPPCMPIRKESNGVYGGKASDGPASPPKRRESHSYSEKNNYGVPCSPSTSPSLIDDDDYDSDDEDVRNFLKNISICRQEVAPPPPPSRVQYSHDRFSPIAPSTSRKHGSSDNLMQVKSILKKNTRHSNPNQRNTIPKAHSNPDYLRHTVH